MGTVVGPSNSDHPAKNRVSKREDIVNTENDEDTFARRPSLDVAVMEASQVQGQCSMTPPPEQTPKNVKIKYEEGVLIGTTLFQQVSRCMLFSAALSAKKLERVFTSHGYRFLLDSKPVTTFPDVVTLEISPAPACTTGLHNAVDVRAADLEGLTFQFRWHGPGNGLGDHRWEIVARSVA